MVHDSTVKLWTAGDSFTFHLNTRLSLAIHISRVLIWHRWLPAPRSSLAAAQLEDLSDSSHFTLSSAVDFHMLMRPQSNVPHSYSCSAVSDRWQPSAAEDERCLHRRHNKPRRGEARRRKEGRKRCVWCLICCSDDSLWLDIDRQVAVISRCNLPLRANTQQDRRRLLCLALD